MEDSRMELVRRFFAGTGPTYDFMVNFGTFGCDRFWKKKILSRVPATSKRVLDLACGTGIVTFGIAKRLPSCRVIGVDITKEYLDVAIKKAKNSGLTHIEFIHRKAEEATFDEPFDCVTASYLAKYADLHALVKNVKGILKENGLFIIHDFTYPRNRLIAFLWECYFKLLQTIGIRFYPEWREVFYGLPDLLRNTTWIHDLTTVLRQHGYSEITVERLTLGSAAIVTAKNGRPKAQNPTG